MARTWLITVSLILSLLPNLGPTKESQICTPNQPQRMLYFCYWVQAHSAENGRLVPQNNHLSGVWMPGCFIDQRERSNEELKSKGRIERERQWASKVKGSSVFQNISKGMSSLWKRCVNLFYSQVVRDKLSPGAEPRHFSLQSSREAGTSRQAIEYDYNNKRKSKKLSNLESELASSLQHTQGSF